MLLIGDLGPFDSDKELWLSYKECLEQFLAANSVAQEKHVAVLLSVISGKAYELLWSLMGPAKPAQKRKF